jgi:SAM-dependent methyltransferase
MGGKWMLQNEYDHEKFFAEYAKMPRSREGLTAAGEWHQLQPLFPPLEGKRVLDLGCGYGWHCKFAASQGAVQVLGLDLSRKMIAEAQKRNVENQIEYRICGIEEYEYPENMWDCVISNLALHYIAPIDRIFQKVHKTLKQDGIFLFNIEHPVFTAGVGQDWVYTDEGTPKYWPIDNYFFPGERNTHFLGCDIVKQHHTLTQILMGLLNNGFELNAVEEAEQPAEMRDFPEMKDEMRRPMMLLVKATAKKAVP